MNATIKGLVDSVEKQFGRGALVQLGSPPASVSEVDGSYSTGSVGLDLATGIGGLPRGRVIEVYGPPTYGKRMLVLSAIAAVQRAKDGTGVAAYVDLEHGFDLEESRSAGIVTEKLLVSQPDTGEQALDIVDVLARSGAVDIIVVDSVGAMTPCSTIEGDTSPYDRDQQMGLQARLMSSGLRKLTAIAHRTGTMIVFVNHLLPRVSHSNFDMPAPGGNALKFYASMRLDVRNVGDVKRGDEIVGERVHVKIAKNKMAAPFTEAKFDVRFGTGVDVYGELLDLGLERGVLTMTNRLFVYPKSPHAPSNIGSRERGRELLQADSAYRASLAEAVAASAK